MFFLQLSLDSGEMKYQNLLECSIVETGIVSQIVDISNDVRHLQSIVFER